MVVGNKKSFIIYIENMNEQNYTSLELSKKLKENWFEWEVVIWRKHHWVDGAMDEWELVNKKEEDRLYDTWWIIYLPVYDILNDLCVRYTKEMFGDKQESIPTKIFHLIKDWKKQEAEEYIRENCFFNPKNK